MSLFSDYHKELGIKQVIESEHGFILYSILGNDCYIEDVYVVPEQRKSRVCWEMADKVVEEAKSKGCKLLIGTVIPTANNSTTSLKMLLSYGFKPRGQNNQAIIFTKEI